MDSLWFLLPHLVNGLTLGLLFALIVLGFMLIVSVMEVINLAHGSLFALGAYFAMTVIAPDLAVLDWWRALPLSLRYVIALVVAPAVLSVVGMALEVCLRRTYGKDPLYGLLLTFGAALVLEELIRLLWGSAEQIMPTPDAISGGFIAGGLIWSTYRFYAAAFALGVILLVWLFLEKTPYGALVKAGAHDSEMVQALGINLTRLRLLVFAFGTALAGVAGIILTPIWGLRPHVGIDAVVPAFLIVVLGGIGSFGGTVAASIMVGLAIGVTGAFFSEWSLLSIYILLIVVVTFRARGLAGKKSVLEA
jgi:branched-subunit amino acid ABC-type transport system permease component